MRWFALLLVASNLAACARPGPASRAPPAAGAVARVGGVAIAAATVARTTAAIGGSARQAVGALIDDELLAENARRRHVEADTRVRWELASTFAARTVAHVRRSAEERGSPTAEELSETTVVHAVVLARPGLSEAQGASLAESIRHDVVDARTVDDFVARAKGVATGGARVVVEMVGPFGADGLDDRGGALDPTFVSASFALRSVGETSAVVRTPFGWHTIRLVRRDAVDPTRMDERRRDLAGVIVSLRARQGLGDVLRLRRTRTRVIIEAQAEALMELTDKVLARP